VKLVAFDSRAATTGLFTLEIRGTNSTKECTIGAWFVATPSLNSALTFGVSWIALFHVRLANQRQRVLDPYPRAADVDPYEAATLWLFANGHIGFLKWSRNTVWFVAMMVLIPFFREFHFHVVHRFIHWPPMHRAVHSLHHRNNNPRPSIPTDRSIFCATSISKSTIPTGQFRWTGGWVVSRWFCGS
jgi:hypothetical protein